MQGRYDKATPLIAEVQAALREEHEDDGPRVAFVLGMLGENLIAEREYAQAESVLSKCVATWEKSHSRGMFFTMLGRRGAARESFFAQALLGTSLLGQKKYTEAEKLLLQACEGLKRGPEAGRTDATPLARRYHAEALGWLVQLYDQWGKPDEAAKWRKELEGANAAVKPAAGP